MMRSSEGPIANLSGTGEAITETATITELLGGLKELNITHRDSYQDPCLQAVDFVCGAIYRCYNRDDPKYFEIIKNSCIVKHEMWNR
ncbi:MAG: DUF3800 domain-containing protein [Methanosarcinales archaeon]|nr:DUF3800 domain-containing protein [Methanosarcinales archaeon]